MKKWILVIAGAWVFLLLTLWLFEYALMTEEKRVLRRVEELRVAAEAGKMLKLSDYISGDYRDDYDFDKRGVLGAVASLRREYSDLSLHVERIHVQVKGDEGEADVRGRATGRMELIERGEFILSFRKVDKEWKLTRLAKKEKSQEQPPGR
ncbi:MAG: hypothetical protein HZA91_01305 [Verrucomicrobia bacterium]|nr:hypothetical protein [Verrucomicrobiota bacterium]